MIKATVQFNEYDKSLLLDSPMLNGVTVFCYMSTLSPTVLVRGRDQMCPIYDMFRARYR